MDREIGIQQMESDRAHLGIEGSSKMAWRRCCAPVILDGDAPVLPSDLQVVDEKRLNTASSGA
jgi:hypothetical protein